MWSWFAEDAARLMQEHVQIQAPLLRDVETPFIVAEGARAAVKSNFQSLTASDLALSGKVEHITQGAEKLGDEVARMCGECDR